VASKSKIQNTNTVILIEEAKKLGIKVKVLDAAQGKLKLTWHGRTHILWKKSFGLNSKESIRTARDKHRTFLQLKQAQLPCPNQIKVNSTQEYLKHYRQIPFPQAIKPATGEKGQSLYLNVKNKKQALRAIKTILAKKHRHIVVEEYLPGLDMRFFILNGKTLGIARRTPPYIIGNNHSTIKQLIHQENQRRLELTQKTGRRMLNRLLIWKRIRWYLKQQNLNLDSIPTKNQQIVVYPIPNFSTGGSVKTFSRQSVHPSLIKTAEKAVNALNLTVAGVDMVVKDKRHPATKKNCLIIEVNSDPSLRLHEWPNSGKPQHITKKLLRYIFKSQT
jgi:D-alanine-D-alanine ligase-like ATP-grasp enzyme